MYTVRFYNFNYSVQCETLEEALNKAKQSGYECVIEHNGQIIKRIGV